MQVFARTPGDGVINLSRLGPGGVLGEFSLLDGGRRSAGARAIEPTIGYFISRSRFDVLRRSARPAAFEVIDRLRTEVARRARSTIDRIRDSEAHDLEGTLRRPGISKPLALEPPDAFGDLVRLLPPFRGFTPNELSDLVAFCARMEASRGRRLASAGNQPDHLFIIVRGAVRTGVDRGGDVEQLLIHGPGDMAGLFPLMDGGSHPAALDVREDALLLVMERRHFETLRKGHSELGAKFFDRIGTQMTQDLRRLSRHIGRSRTLSRCQLEGIDV